MDALVLANPLKKNVTMNGLSEKSVAEKDMTDRKKSDKKINFKIRSSTDQITKTVQKFDKLLEKLGCCSAREKNELATALSEALANAIIHGNKADPRKTVNVEIKIFENKIIIIVEDKGQGFNPEKIQNPLKPENLLKPNGRGIYLMSLFTDKLDFKQTKRGMQVVLTKYLKNRS